MSEALRKALEAALDIYMDCGDPPYYREESHRPIAAVIAAFLEALPNGLTLTHGDDWRADIDDEVMHALAAAVRRAAETVR